MWRPSIGYWFVKDAQTGTILYQTQWGSPAISRTGETILGLGRAQFAVWRPSNGYWFIQDPLTGYVAQIQWGLQGDIPIPGEVTTPKRDEQHRLRLPNSGQAQRHTGPPLRH